jgi:regulator of nonsense transcripts 1
MAMEFLSQMDLGAGEGEGEYNFLEMNTQNSQPNYDSSTQSTQQYTDSSQYDDTEDGYQENDDEIIEDTIPEHACSYCGYADTASVVRCNAANCKKWFCNGRGCTSGAHVVQHMIRSKHKEVSLHPQGPLGDTVLECFVCGNKNVFLLGFVPSKTDSVVILLCRDPCLTNTQVLEADIDTSTWLPLIEDRQLLPWLVKIPTKEETSRTRQISANQIGKLEDLWKTKPNGTLEDLTRNEMKGEPDAVVFFYEDAFHYQAVFTPLISLEAEYDESLKAQQAKDNIVIQWSQGISSKTIGTLVFPREDSDQRLVLGDEIRISHPTQQSSTLGVVVRLNITPQSTDEITVEIRGGPYVAKEITTNFTVEMVWKAAPFDRMKQAMRVFAHDETSVSAYLYHRLLGHAVDAPTLKVEVPTEINAPALPELNHSQASAVRNVLTKPLSLIQGPPGTGKTVTSATLVYHMCTLNQAQVLVTAPSNVAVDHLAERIHLTGLKVVRLCARSRESVASTIDFLTLHHQVHQMAKHSPGWSTLHKLKQLRDETGQLSSADESKYLSLLRAVEQDILANADVICATCTGAGDNRLTSFRFKHVLIDESTQACEPETLIPMVLGCRQVVLVGDHCQLGPVIACKEAVKAGLGRSLFERLVLLGVRPYRLQIQYRMHPCISEFPSNAFYEGTLQNGVTHDDRARDDHAFPWPNPSKPMFFYNSIGQEEFSGSGTSYLNRTEAALVEKCVTQLLQAGVTPDNIGVITPYEGQRAYIVNFLQRNGAMPAELYKRMEVSSVDAFQGREKEYTILSCVRSNDHQGIGFLNDKRRLNVALTRAQCGLIIIGNARVLSRDVLWHSLISHFKQHGLIVEGPLNQLRAVNIQLPKPREPKQPFGNSAVTTVASAPDMYQESYTADGRGKAQVPSEKVPYHPNMTPAAQTQAYVRAVQNIALEHTQGEFAYTQSTQSSQQ